MASPLKPLPRRLFELLEEQQEPFLLHENGCSKGGFKPNGTFWCWSLNSHGFRRRRARARARAGVLRSFVTTLVYLKVIKKALKWERRKLAGCFSEMGSEASAAGFHRLSSCSAAGEGELSGEIGWKETEHSPVSVLELHSDEGSSDQNHSMEEGNQSTASRFNSPTKAKAVVSIQPRQLLLDFFKEMEEKSCDHYELLGQKMSGNIMQKEIFPWEKQWERGDVAIFTQLLALDLSETRREWTQFSAGRSEIGTEIGGIIFDEMREECVFDMLGLNCTLET